jgi:hypothetical protein
MKIFLTTVAFLVAVSLSAQVKLPSGCATKDMKEKFGYKNDNDSRWWSDFKKGVIVAAYNTTLRPSSPNVFKVSLQKNTAYDVGVIFSTKDKRGVLYANPSFESDISSNIPDGFTWGYSSNSKYIRTGDADIIITIKITGGKYYDLRDTEILEPVCAIVYVDRLFN